MPPEQRSPDDPHEWLRRARSNLARAQADIRLAGVYLEDLCFDAQQAAEKAIKAVLIGQSIRFPYVHDLTVLLGLVEQSGTTVPEAVREAGRLTRFAVVTRYPGIAEPVTRLITAPDAVGLSTLICPMWLLPAVMIPIA